MFRWVCWGGGRGGAGGDFPDAAGEGGVRAPRVWASFLGI